MSKVNDTNYANQVPVPEDYTIFVRDSDGVIKTATMTQLAALFQSLASLINTVAVYSSNQVLGPEDQFVEANAGGGLTLTLPASSLNTGRSYRIFNRGAGAATIMPNGSDTIAGEPSLVLAQYEAAVLQSDGLGTWAVFAG